MLYCCIPCFQSATGSEAFAFTALDCYYDTTASVYCLTILAIIKRLLKLLTSQKHSQIFDNTTAEAMSGNTDYTIAEAMSGNTDYTIAEVMSLAILTIA